MINFELDKGYIFPLQELPDDIQFDFKGTANVDQGLKNFHFSKKPLDKHIYDHGFDLAMHEILYGNSFLLNLTYPTEIETSLSLDEIYQFSQAKYKVHFKNRFVCFSPEIFVQMKDNGIHTYPMKGTIDATVENAESKILESEKETAEHYTIVDLLRNDLSMVSTDVEVVKFRYIDYLETNQKSLLQVSSHIKGTLPNNWHSQLGDIFQKLLPAGSISGAPKKKTLEIIRLAEIGKRGFYTGVAGVFDGSQVDSAVMIRFIEKSAGKLFFRSGGGMTFQSQKSAEYQELLDKVYVPIKTR